MPSIINTILAKDERAAKYIQLMSEFNRGITDIEYEPGDDKMWVEHEEKLSHFFYRYNDFKFIIKREGYHKVLYTQFQEEIFASIKAIPDIAFEQCKSIIKEAEETMGKKIGKYETNLKKLSTKYLDVRNKLPKLAQDIHDKEEEFLQEYYKDNRENIEAYMEKEYNLSNSDTEKKKSDSGDE